MKKYLAYCRVSTKAQADRDNSLPVQRRAITEYAQKKKLEVVEWYSEAKSGFKGKRTEFHKMIEQLKDPSIEGVIFHKLDRSSRNVGDFSVLDKLMTKEGKKIVVIEGEFDTEKAAGRLAFRQFCNMAVWYSENLSEEVNAKMAECLRKGYYPTHAPIGYRIGIKGQDDDFKKKYPDPKLAPFVKESFRLFATGNYSLRSLCDYMKSRGMTNSHGGELRKGVFERMLKNPFYYGTIKWQKKNTGKIILYQGNHETLITKALYEKVQAIIEGRTQQGKTKHDYIYSKMVKCTCGNYLIASKHKDHIYLECQNKKCDFTSIREEQLEDKVITLVARYSLEGEFVQYSKFAIKEMSGNIRKDNKAKRKALNMQLSQLDGRLQKLNNAVIEGFFDPQEGIDEKNKIVEQKQTLIEQLGRAETEKEDTLWNLTERVISFFNILPNNYRNLSPIVKRKLLNFLFLNLRLDGQKLLVEAVSEFENLRLANNRLEGEKLLLNLRPDAEKPLKEAFPIMAESLSKPDFPNGRGPGTRTRNPPLPKRVL